MSAITDAVRQLGDLASVTNRVEQFLKEPS